MRFSLALLPFVAAAVALPVAQPVVRAPVDLIDLPGTILGGLPQLDVSEILAELNTTLHGVLPTIPPTVIAQIQSVIDTIQGGAKLTGDHNINSDFAAKAAGFNWGHGGDSHSEGGMGGGMGGDYDIPPWLLELLRKLIELLGQVGGGPIGNPPGVPSPPIGSSTTIPFPPTDAPFSTGFPTDGPFPPTVSTSILTTSTELPVPTDESGTLTLIELPTDIMDQPPTVPSPRDDTTEPVSTDLPTDTRSTEDPSSTLAPVPTITRTFPTIPPPGETDTDVDTIGGHTTGTTTGSATSTGTAVGGAHSGLPDGI